MLNFGTSKPGLGRRGRAPMNLSLLDQIKTPPVLHKCDYVLRVSLRIVVNHIHARIMRPIDGRIIMKGWIIWIIFGRWSFHLFVSWNEFACENSGVIHLT